MCPGHDSSKRTAPLGQGPTGCVVSRAGEEASLTEIRGGGWSCPSEAHSLAVLALCAAGSDGPCRAAVGGDLMGGA